MVAPKRTPQQDERIQTLQKAFIGKTVRGLECFGVNSYTFRFTDGTGIKLEAEHIGFGLYGMMPVAAHTEGQCSACHPHQRHEDVCTECKCLFPEEYCHLHNQAGICDRCVEYST